MNRCIKQEIGAFQMIFRTWNRALEFCFLLKYLYSGGSRRDKQLMIDEYVRAKYDLARSLSDPVHNADLRRWALEKAYEVR